MQVDSTTKYPDMNRVWMVVGTLLLACPFYRLGWDMSVALYMAAGQDTSVLIYSVCGAVSFTIGACCSTAVVGYFQSIRKAAAVGTLLMVPFLFVYWAFVTTAVVNVYVLNGYFWRGLLTGCLGSIGHGILSACSVGYLARAYSASHNSYTGRVLGHFFFLIPLVTLVYILMLCAYGSNLNAAVVGACLAFVSAIMWYTWIEPLSAHEGDRVDQEAWGMWDQTQRYLVMLAPFSASAGFCAVGCLYTMGGTLNQSFMMVLTSLSASAAGIVFFGWGHDSCRARAQQVWHFFALATTLFVFLNCLGYMKNMVVLTACLCNLTGTGGFIYYLAHMLHNSDHSEMNTSAAAFTLIGSSTLVVAFFTTFFAGSILPVVLLAVLVLLTIGVTVQGLPLNRNEYTQLGQHS